MCHVGKPFLLWHVPCCEHASFDMHHLGKFFNWFLLWHDNVLTTLHNFVSFGYAPWTRLNYFISLWGWVCSQFCFLGFVPTTTTYLLTYLPTGDWRGLWYMSIEVLPTSSVELDGEGASQGERKESVSILQHFLPWPKNRRVSTRRRRWRRRRRREGYV
jgi:hypothetical protein